MKLFSAAQATPGLPPEQLGMIRYETGLALARLDRMAEAVEYYQQAAAGFERFLAAHPDHALSDSAAFRVGECYYNLKAFNSASDSAGRSCRRYSRPNR